MYKNYTCIYHYMHSGCKVGCYADNNHSIDALLNIDHIYFVSIRSELLSVHLLPRQLQFQ